MYDIINQVLIVLLSFLCTNYKPVYGLYGKVMSRSTQGQQIRLQIVKSFLKINKYQTIICFILVLQIRLYEHIMAYDLYNMLQISTNTVTKMVFIDQGKTVHY